MNNSDHSTTVSMVLKVRASWIKYSFMIKVLSVYLPKEFLGMYHLNYEIEKIFTIPITAAILRNCPKMQLSGARDPASLKRNKQKNSQRT